MLLLFFGSLHAQPLRPADYGLKEIVLRDPSLGVIRFYVSIAKPSIKSPLFFEVNGSGGLPLCLYIKGKGFGSTSLTFDQELLRAAVANSYRYVVLGKPGTLFCDSIETNMDASHYDAHVLAASYPFSAEYTRRLSLKWRVEATRKVVDYLTGHGYYDGSKIVAYGYSEGAQVVPSLAVADHRITQVVCVAGSGLNQFYDGILEWRIKAAEGRISQEQAQDSIRVELDQIKEIYRHPHDTSRQFRGHSFQRWASFGSFPPFEQLRKLKIPIYMIVATADDNSPIYGLDYVQLDFIRLGKTNLTYDPCVGCDHYLQRTDNAKQSKADYMGKIMAWLRGADH